MHWVMALRPDKCRYNTRHASIIPFSFRFRSTATSPAVAWMQSCSDARWNRKLNGIMDNRHFYVIGKSGFGKSTFLKNEILQEIETGDRAVIYIDPHGPDALDLLNAIPSWQIRNVCYIDLADREYAVGFNPIAEPHLLVTAFKTIWADSWGPRLEHFLRHGVTVIHEAGLTLRELPALYYDEVKRAKALVRVTSPETLKFWRHEYLKAYPERERQQAAMPIYNKVGAILASSIARNLTQLYPRLDLAEAIREKKIIVVNLAKPAVGDEAATVFGSLFTTSVRNVLMANPAPLSFFADEFHTYGTDVYISMLSELRKFGLRLGLSHQFPAQLDETLFAAILANARDIIAFQLSHQDAVRLAPHFNREHQAFNPSALTALLPHTAMWNGQEAPMPPFSHCRSRLKPVLDQSRLRYARRIPPPLARQGEPHISRNRPLTRFARRRKA